MIAMISNELILFVNQKSLKALLYQNRKPMKCDFGHMNNQGHETEN